MKVYTRGGDKGTTSLVGGSRVDKNHPRIEAYGTLDELNSWIGLVISEPDKLPEAVSTTLLIVQNRLFDIGTILATEPSSKWQPEAFPAKAIEELENAIDILDTTVPAHNQFILPGGCTASARAQVARTVARRAERLICALSKQIDIQPEIAAYVNRLSDYLFVVGRAANIFNGHDEIFWKKNC